MKVKSANNSYHAVRNQLFHCDYVTPVTLGRKRKKKNLNIKYDTLRYRKYSMHMSALWTTTKLHLGQGFICHVLLSPFCLKQLILHHCGCIEGYECQDAGVGKYWGKCVKVAPPTEEPGSGLGE